MRGVGKAAVLVAVLALAGCTEGRVTTAPADEPDQPAASGTSSPSTTGRPPPPRPVRLRDLDDGAPPRIGYVHEFEYVAPDGARTALPRRRGVSAIAPYDGGVVFADAVFFEGTSGLHLLDARGRLSDLRCFHGRPAPAPSGELVAWATVPCPETGTSQPPATIHFAGRSQAVAGALVGVVGVVGEQVVYVRGFGAEGVWITDLAGPPRRIPGLVEAVRVGADLGLVVGRSRPDGPSRVVRISTGRALWSSRGWELDAFSPDGLRVLGLRYGSAGLLAAAVFDARTGRLQHSLALPVGLAAVDAEWEDDRHLLMVAVQGRHTAIIRSGLDGRITLATPPAPTPAHAPGFLLAERP